MIGRVLYFALLAILALAATGAELDRSARFDPSLAPLVPKPFAGFAEQRLAEQAILAGKPEEAVMRAKALVARRPLPAEHLTLLAQADALAGEDAAALAALEAAARRGWREPFAQNAMAAAALSAGEYDIAAQRLSALWAIGLERDRLGNLTRAMLETPLGRAAFARRLAAGGRWQANFLSGAGTLVDPEPLVDTIVRAREEGASIDCRALFALATALDRQGEPGLAERMGAGCGATAEGR